MPRPRKFNQTKTIQQTMKVFWQKGYEATSISDLTEATDLKPGSLYNAFGSKHAIYIESLNYYLRNIGGQVFEVLDDSIPGLEAIQACFDGLIDAELADPLQRGCFMQNAIMERASCDVDVRNLASSAKADGLGAFQRALERAKATGDIREDVSITDTARYLVGIVYAIRTLSQTTRNRSELEAVVQIALSTLA